MAYLNLNNRITEQVPERQIVNDHKLHRAPKYRKMRRTMTIHALRARKRAIIIKRQYFKRLREIAHPMGSFYFSSFLNHLLPVFFLLYLSSGHQQYIVDELNLKLRGDRYLYPEIILCYWILYLPHLSTSCRLTTSSRFNIHLFYHFSFSRILLYPYLVILITASSWYLFYLVPTD